MSVSRPGWLTRWLLAMALVCGQAVSQLHALEHVMHEAGHGDCAHGSGDVGSTLAESGACLLVHALDSVLPAVAPACPGGAILAAAFDPVSTPFLPGHAGPFEPRAPPVFS